MIFRISLPGRSFCKRNYINQNHRLGSNHILPDTQRYHRQTPDEELEEELNTFEKIYNYDGNTVFKHEFDLRKFCEENLY